MAKKGNAKKAIAKSATVKKVSNISVVETENPVEVDVKIAEEGMNEVKEEQVHTEEPKTDLVNDELLIMNQDEDVVEKATHCIEKTNKTNNDKGSHRTDNMFGYFWNGQEMDY